MATAVTTLYSYPSNKNAYKALIAAEYAGIKIECPDFRMGVDNRSEDFLRKFPLGKVPAMESAAGCFFESNAIARHIVRAGGSATAHLMGRTPYERAQVDMWVDFAGCEVDPAILAWCLPLAGVYPYSPAKEAAAVAATKRALDAVESHLARGRTYLVGDAPTLADIVMACNLLLGFKNVFDPSFRETLPHLTQFFTRIVALPHVAKVVGPVQMCAAAPKAPQ